MKRLKYGATKYMTPDEYKQYKRDLGKRWRKNNKAKIKAKNKYYAELYKQTKPCECICKNCGRKFNAPRKYYKLCSQCLEENHYIAEVKRKTVALKQEERIAEYKEIVRMSKQGFTQMIIAETFGRTQSGISSILRRMKNRPCKK